MPSVFDLRGTPGWTGLIPETLRLRKGAVRSLHPTHSAAAIGAGAPYLVGDHLECETPCGPGPPSGSVLEPYSLREGIMALGRIGGAEVRVPEADAEIRIALREMARAPLLLVRRENG